MSEKNHTKYDDGEPRGDITLPVGIEGVSLLEGAQLGTELGGENGIFPNGIMLCIDSRPLSEGDMLGDIYGGTSGDSDGSPSDDIASGL